MKNGDHRLFGGSSRLWASYVVALMLLGCGGCQMGFMAGTVAPPHVSQAQVNVAYAGPKLSPDGNTAFFIKTVTQERTGKAYTVVQTFVGHWENAAFQEWTRAYLCRSNANGSDAQVVSEIFARQYAITGETYRPENWDTWRDIVGFDISWTRLKSVVVFDGATNNVVVTDLQTGTSMHYTSSASKYGSLKLQVIDGGSRILAPGLAPKNRIGVFDFEWHELSTNSLTSSGDLHFRSPPMWNEKQKVMVFELSSRSGKSYEWWVYNSSFELIEKVDQQTITALNKQWL